MLEGLLFYLTAILVLGPTFLGYIVSDFRWMSFSFLTIPLALVLILLYKQSS